MAELKKMEEYQYEIPMIEEPADTPEVLVEVPHLPKRRLQHISRMEKIIAVLLLLGVIAMSVLTIQLRTNITKVENSVSEVQQTIIQNEAELSKLKQEKSELSRIDRIQDIAKELGLTENADNLRKVK